MGALSPLYLDVAKNLAVLNNQQPPNFNSFPPSAYALANCVSLGSDNGLSPIRRQTIIWTSSELSSVGPLGINFSVILI